MPVMICTDASARAGKKGDSFGVARPRTPVEDKPGPQDELDKLELKINKLKFEEKS